MSTSAIIMMIVGFTMVWGGLAASVGWAVHLHRRGKDHTLSAFATNASRA